MQTTIGAFDALTRTVPVTFEHAGIVSERPVNACTDEQGAYDPEATAERVADVARGVAIKIEVGAITGSPPEPDE